MKTWQYLRLIALVGLLSLTTCKQKDLGPSIDEAVGEYDATLEWTGGSSKGKRLAKSFIVTKQATNPNSLEVQIAMDEYSTETWKINYSSGGNLIMDKQVVYSNPTNYGYTSKRYQQAIGKFNGDSLSLDGEVFFEPRNVWGQTYCQYRAKKKR